MGPLTSLDALAMSEKAGGGIDGFDTAGSTGTAPEDDIAVCKQRCFDY